MQPTICWNIICDARCCMCGAGQKRNQLTNHVFFECPPVLQTWIFSMIFFSPAIFLSSSIFTNMDYLFWRLPKEEDLIIIHRYYDIFGRLEMTRFIQTGTATHMRYCGWPMWKVRYGWRHS